MTMLEIDELPPEEYSEFLIDGEVEEAKEYMLVFDDCEQMIEVRL